MKARDAWGDAKAAAQRFPCRSIAAGSTAAVGPRPREGVKGMRRPRVKAARVTRMIFRPKPPIAAGTPIRISAVVGERGRELELRIDDEGPGLPPGREDAVFEKFERGGKESATPGVGLGLAICRAIVQAHGGRIEGMNRLAEGRVLGTRMRITLPCADPPPGDGSELPAPLTENRA